MSVIIIIIVLLLLKYYLYILLLHELMDADKLKLNNNKKINGITDENKESQIWK